MANISADFVKFNFVDFLYIPLTNHIWAGWIGPIESLCLKRTRCDGGLLWPLPEVWGEPYGGEQTNLYGKKRISLGLTNTNS